MTMADHIRRHRLGAATITVINVGDMQVSLGEWIDVSQRTVPPHYAAAFREPLRLPIQCTHIELPGISVLVDASDSDFTPGSPGAIPEYQPPPDLSSGLAEVG